MRIVLGILTCFVTLATTLPFIRAGAWWIRIFDFPRLQIALLSLLTLVGYLTLNETRALPEQVAISLLLLVIGYQTFRMLPYTPLVPKQALPSRSESEGERCSLLVANVLMTNRNSELLLHLIDDCDPDLVLLVETDAWWQQALHSLEESYPHRVLHPLENTYGMLLYARFTLHEPEVRFLVEDDVPSIHTTVVLPSRATFQLIGLHPRPPRPDKNQDSTERDAEVALVGKALEGETNPTIVAGDLNDVAWSYTTRLFQRLSGLLDPRRGRGLYSTFHADYPFLRYPLDHIFHSKHFRVVRMERLGKFGSDHFPIFIELSYEPHHSDEQQPPPEEPDDAETADEMIEEA